jgi:hypothetical protein
MGIHVAKIEKKNQFGSATGATEDDNMRGVEKGMERFSSQG